MKNTLSRSNLLAVVGITAFAILMMELLLARMYVFFIGNVSSFIAIPITMLGLSIGTLILHWRPQIVKEPFIKPLVGLLFFSLIVSFFGFYYLFNHVFGLSNWYNQNPIRDASRTIALTLIFVPSFAVAGMLLSIIFKLKSNNIGRLYAVDLACSASACVTTIVILHYWGLANAIIFLITIISLLLVSLLNKNRKLYFLFACSTSFLMYLGANQHLILTEKFEAEMLAGQFAEGDEIKQLKYRWDEVSRVSLVQNNSQENPYMLYHDDGVSAVFITEYKPEKVNTPSKPPSLYNLPFLLDSTTESALVLFAGTGKDMIKLNEYAEGNIKLTGVELSRLVPLMATTEPYDIFNLNSFYERPNVNYLIDEGRAFLGRSDKKYDMIFMGTNGATVSTRFGDTRKYLDTYEAIEEMLDHLTSNGILFFRYNFFHNERLEAFKKIFEERNYAPFEDSIIRLGIAFPQDRDVYMIKPSGFSKTETQNIINYIHNSSPRTESVWYAPNEESVPGLKELYSAPHDKNTWLSTDNRPYPKVIDFKNFKLIPNESLFTDITYGPENAAEWLKLFTLIFFTGLSILLFVAFYALGGNKPKLPVSLFCYFVTSGISYMLVQISMISKLELFFGQPLYSMMIVLTSFLLFNALGAFFTNWWNANRPKSLSAINVAISAIIITPLCFYFTEQLVHFIGLNLILKSILAIVCLAPVAFVLGMFYPLGVKFTADKNLEHLIPMTFGLATLSSVIGGVFTLVFVIVLGFWNMILLALAGYLLLMLIIMRGNLVKVAQ